MRYPAIGGTRFRLYPSYAEGFAEPEVVELSLRAGTVRAGPSDHSICVVNPVRKDAPYDPPHYVPPFRGPVYAPALPGPDGHFDHIPAETEQFLAAHLYGTVRWTLDVWEHYLRRRIVWLDADAHPQLELIPVVRWPNAQSGPGFLETGIKPNRLDQPQPFCLNYDVMAHETGHAILFSQIGVPEVDQISVPFLAFHESFADLVALIGVLHFESVQTRLLEQTGGNLYVLNLVNRIGEISDTEQIRLADNLATMDDVTGIALAADGTWIDPTGQGRNQHAVAEPLTGAVFDMLVELYQDSLVRRGLIPPSSDPRGWTRTEVAASMARVQQEHAAAYSRFTQGFYAALVDARQVVGRCMAHVMLTVRPETLTFGVVAARFLEAAAALGQASIMCDLLDNFLWRAIDPRPFLTIAIPPGPRRRRVEPRGRLGVLERPNPGPYCAGCGPPGLWPARRLMAHPHRMSAT
jgi:hypothetical protein